MRVYEEGISLICLVTFHTCAAVQLLVCEGFGEGTLGAR